MAIQTKPLDGALVEAGLITKEQLAAALKEQEEKGGFIGGVLGRLQFCAEDAVSQFAAKYRGAQYVDLSRLVLPDELVKLVPAEIAHKYRAIPVKKFRDRFTFAVTDPAAPSLIHISDDYFRGRAGSVEFVVSTESSILAALEKYYAQKPTSTLDNTVSQVGGLKSPDGENGQDVGDLEVMTETVDAEPDTGMDEAPVIRLVNSIIHDGVERKVSDIHVDPFENGVVIRYRIDGVLHDVSQIPANFKRAIVARIKVMTKQMKIEERRKPQDAKIKVRVGDRTIDLRVSTLPVVWGEKIVMRILDQSNLNLDLSMLGFEPEEMRKYEKAIHSPYGMILVTGPTGSGKTTTLYSALSSVNSRAKNIMTAEDPVEYQLPGINQVQIVPEAGMTFAAALKAFLRQDPNIIMVGEIRDFETAEIAIKAALTGHLVLSTLHTNDAPSTITRLVDMRDPISGSGIDTANIATAVNLVLAQRLMRRICPKCKKETTYTPDTFAMMGLAQQEFAGTQLFKGEGCANCNKSGYRGRVAIYEVMEMSLTIRDLLMKHADVNVIRQAAMKEGMNNLRMSAIRKAKAGFTTLEEIHRVTLE